MKRKTNKKGDVWVSAVLYFGLGIIVIAIILTAATPVISRLRDKNIIIQTKQVMQVLDSNIREVAREGPGAQRPLTIDIRKGAFRIDPATSSVIWSYNSKALIAEPDIEILEGNIRIRSSIGGPSNTYPTTLSLNYEGGAYLRYDAPVRTISGNTALIIRNAGITCGPTPTTPLASQAAQPYASAQREIPPAGVTVQDQCPCIAGHQNGACPPTTPRPLPTVELRQR